MVRVHKRKIKVGEGAGNRKGGSCNCRWAARKNVEKVLTG